MSLFKRGNVWWYKFQFGGQVIRESTKSKLKTLAREAENARREELRRTWNKIEKRTLPPTLSRAVTTWLEGRKSAISPQTVATYEAATKHLKAFCGKRLVCDLSAEDIRDYQQKRHREGAAAATVNKEVICLCSILRHCGMGQNIQRKVKLLEEPESSGSALESEEEACLLAAVAQVGQVQGHWSPVYPVTVLALNTGMRHSEIRQLRWEQVNLETRVLIVGKSKTKAGSGRCVPLNQPAWAALDMWAARFPNQQSDQFVFPACENGRIDPNRPISNWRTAWDRACRNAELYPLGFHSLRHCAVTKLLENGVPFATVAQILGWSASTAVRMAKRYGHIRPDVLRAALERIATQEISVPGVRTTQEIPEGGHKNGHIQPVVLKSPVAN